MERAAIHSGAARRWPVGAVRLAAATLSALLPLCAAAEPVWHCRSQGVELLVAGGTAPAARCARAGDVRPAPALRADSATVTTTAAAPSNAAGQRAAIDAGEQAARDADRKRILESELARAHNELAQASQRPQQALQRQRAADDIAALQRELARL